MEQLKACFDNKLASLEKSLEEKHQKDIADLKVLQFGDFAVN
jgi:hypothetical protein